MSSQTPHYGATRRSADSHKPVLGNPSEPITALNRHDHGAVGAVDKSGEGIEAFGRRLPTRSKATARIRQLLSEESGTESPRSNGEPAHGNPPPFNPVPNKDLREILVGYKRRSRSRSWSIREFNLFRNVSKPSPSPMGEDNSGNPASESMTDLQTMRGTHGNMQTTMKVFGNNIAAKGNVHIQTNQQYYVTYMTPPSQSYSDIVVGVLFFGTSAMNYRATQNQMQTQPVVIERRYPYSYLYDVGIWQVFDDFGQIQSLPSFIGGITAFVLFIRYWIRA